jgi:DNA polymerase III epsilon subunit-like protein
MLFVDLETCFLSKGFKRIHQQILEIGMCQGKKTFQCMVNPCGDKPIVQTLEDMGQDPEKSINFWTKLLIGKGMLNSAVKRKDMQTKADAIQEISGDFLSPMDAIQQAHAFAGDETWVAHNGKSFDFHILRAHLDKAELKHPKFVDSLPILRSSLDMVSYSQPLVYKKLFKDTYKAHHALHDAEALQRIWKYLKLGDVKPQKSAKSTKGTSKSSVKSELLELYGVGPKSVIELNKNGIFTIRELTRAAKEGKTFKVVRKSVLAELRDF